MIIGASNLYTKVIFGKKILTSRTETIGASCQSFYPQIAIIL